MKGLLKVGTPQPWQKSKPNLRYVREAGVRQFISTYNRVENLKGDELLWGDEIEYGLFVLEPETKSIRLCLRAEQIMDDLNDKEKSHLHRMEGCHWVPEYGGWMIEATPNRPYTGKCLVRYFILISVRRFFFDDSAQGKSVLTK